MSTQVNLEMNELVNFLVSKIKKIFGITTELKVEEPVDEKSSYNIWVNGIGTDREKLDEFVNFLSDLGFKFLEEEENNMYEENSKKRVVQEYMNDDMVRIVLIYDEIQNDNDVKISLLNIFVGPISVIDSDVDKKINEFINILEEFEIEYKHKVRYATRVIEIEGYIDEIDEERSFDFCHNFCVGISVWRWRENGPKGLEIFNLCEVENPLTGIEVHESIELPENTIITYSGGRLYIEFIYK